ncbi:MAG: carboxypeptidase-like regulatory domain-containing protein, partial [Myxococcota bacterium]|nr:carboxypeptidase-like regulatory domain-containing protein [Myxococcota bacterium]
MSQHPPTRRFFALVLILAAAAIAVGVVLWKGLAALSTPHSASQRDTPGSRDHGDKASSQQQEIKSFLHHLGSLVERSSVVVSGTIRGAGEPLPGARVELVSDSGRFSATADDAGDYAVRVPAGAYRIAARA